ncbi:zinc-binding dehydrogenase [Nocardioides sp. CFH 31398]|uniref:zinc-binding dehydrogenase n=1 Tax=Nocardioides sp. CFH 31398 TaxID=2919579 RepID=UPI001F06FFFC|nr:zinc-binding dehydrogenase [Nocardioides sp. CFH 31398]MCH1865515.1 zinc-binding dehydrogenase [Nocardioides sp. CFH 31398]
MSDVASQGADLMRAAVIDRHGGPEVIELRSVPVPRPGPDELVVRVAAAGCNNTDIWTREGAYGSGSGVRAGWLGPLSFPRVQGGDVCGTVVELGAGVGDRDLLGARVLLDPAGYDGPGRDASVADVLGSERDGGFAERVVVPAVRAHRVDDSPLSDVELAALPIAYGTALGMLERGGVGEGQQVLVTGASGGVGLAAVQLSGARGARVVAVCGAHKAAAVLAAGADVVVPRDGDVLTAAADAAPEGYDVVVDLVAGPFLGEGLGLLRRRGRWVVSGALAGSDVAFDVRRLYLSDLTVVGSTMHTRRVFDDLVTIARRGSVRPAVAATYALEHLEAAQRALATREHVGKIVVVPSSC